MTKTKIASLLCLAVIIVFSVSSVSAATENKIQSVSKNNEFKQNLKNLDTTNPVTKEITKKDSKTYDLPQVSGSVQMDENTKAIKVKFNGKEFKITDKDTKALTNELVSGSLIRKNSNGDVASSVEAVDGGIRIVLNIEKTADKFYTYDFPVEAESGTKYIMNGQGTKLVTSDGKVIVSVITPWATDSNKKSLKTWYTVENNGAILRQHVDLSGAKFPVLADPTWCGNVVNSVKWVYRGDEHGNTLSIDPTWCGRILANATSIWTLTGPMYAASYWTVNAVWDEVKSRYWSVYMSAVCYGRYSCYSNADLSMYNQLYCHMFAVPFKPDGWNLEPWRPVVSFSKYVQTQCNP